MTKRWIEGVRRCESARLHPPIRNPPSRSPRNPRLLECEKPLKDSIRVRRRSGERRSGPTPNK
eukprot:13251610-Alexandrium_andersonii.AAC.1